MEKLKLVIWDLDETFWKGILSEGEIVPIHKNIELVKQLTKRGIINSICSKNDFDQAKNKLVELGVWEYFVFPSISWNPKGECVKNIVKNCQLRNPNIIFVDDNNQNLQEVLFYNEGINVVMPEKLSELIGNPTTIGKDDAELSRLKQYKILEEKYKFQQNFSDNTSFLKQSEIRICIIKNLQLYIDRISELIERTNQLNFTKKRISQKEVEVLVANPEYECACIEVKDRFGDYGICGFYALNTKTNILEHFVFSCRILNLYIENYLYNKLGRPTLNIVKPVTANLDENIDVTWVSEYEIASGADEKKDNKRKPRILFIGGCDLEQMCHYIDKNKFEVVTDFNYPNHDGVPVHREHTCYLRDRQMMSGEDKELVYSLPFGDPKMYDMSFFNGDYDILVYSCLMNYTHEVYRHKKKNYRISYGGYMTEGEMMDYLSFTDEQKKSFTKTFQYEGLQTPDSFKEDLEWLVKNTKTPIVFINGAEVDGICEAEPYAYTRHVEMNRTLKLFIDSHLDRCHLIDVRKLTNNKTDFRDTIRHYSRPIYVKMADCLLDVIEENHKHLSSLQVAIKYKMQYFREVIGSLYFRIRRKLKKKLFS